LKIVLAMMKQNETKLIVCPWGTRSIAFRRRANTQEVLGRTQKGIRVIFIFLEKAEFLIWAKRRPGRATGGCGIKIFLGSAGLL
jgi:hypothetical protein